MSDATFFEQMKRSFVDVSITPDTKYINTTEFLEASESLVKLFDLLGSTAFSVVQKDMSGNIEKIRARLLANPDKSETLQDLVLNEKSIDKKRTATQGLLWLNRGLHFTATALRKNVDSTEELTISFQEAYKVTLQKYHSMFVRPVFSLAMKACPYRAEFYAKLGSDADKVKAQLLEWLVALENVVSIILAFFESGNYGKGL